MSLRDELVENERAASDPFGSSFSGAKLTQDAGKLTQELEPIDCATLTSQASWRTTHTCGAPSSSRR